MLEPRDLRFRTLVVWMEKPLTVTAWMAGVLLTGSFLFNCFYNVYLHPLSKVPGSKLAALGDFYEFYYDVIKDGTYIWEIERMHHEYGPIIRVNERELHILDSQYYATMYAGGTRKVNKDPPNIQGFGTPGAVIATVEHDVHRARRSYLNPYFSKRAVVGLEPVIHERIGRLCMRLEQAMHQGQPVDLVAAFAALTGDVVTQRFYGVHFDYLGIEDFKPAALEAFQGLSDIANLSRFLPGLVTFMKTLPIAVLRLIEPSVADLLTLGEEIKQNILTLSPNESKATTEAKSKSLIVEALKDPSIPAEERKIDRLMDEATIALFAGAETTARVLSVAMFHLVNNKSQTRKLVDELKTLPSKEDNAYSLSQLEALPFLTGVINEGLRLGIGPLMHLPRAAMNETLQYKDYVIPPGTPVSTLTYFVHMDPSIFPNPHSFDPERWIKAAQEGVTLTKYLVPFTKGHRVCVGSAMAYGEIYPTIVRLALGFTFELYETTLKEVICERTRVVGYPRTVTGGGKGHNKIQVKMTGKTE